MPAAAGRELAQETFLNTGARQAAVPSAAGRLLAEETLLAFPRVGHLSRVLGLYVFRGEWRYYTFREAWRSTETPGWTVYAPIPGNMAESAVGPRRGRWRWVSRRSPSALASAVRLKRHS